MQLFAFRMPHKRSQASKLARWLRRRLPTTDVEVYRPPIVSKLNVDALPFVPKSGGGAQPFQLSALAREFIPRAVASSKNILPASFRNDVLKRRQHVERWIASGIPFYPFWCPPH